MTRLFCGSDLGILHQSSWKWALRSKGMKWVDQFGLLQFVCSSPIVVLQFGLYFDL